MWPCVLMTMIMVALSSLVCRGHEGAWCHPVAPTLGPMLRLPLCAVTALSSVRTTHTSAQRSKAQSGRDKAEDTLPTYVGDVGGDTSLWATSTSGWPLFCG